jgi:uncharacterized protein involved in exopolysaccharide biosynthesis
MSKHPDPNSLDLLASINNLLHNWWKITLCAVIFSLLGLAFSYIRPPKYEAEALFSVSIDFSEINFTNLVDDRGRPVEFTQYDLDLALSIVQRMLFKVRSRAMTYARTLDPGLDPATFEKNMHIERLHNRWSLRYRHEDPQVAQSIVNYWAELGMAQLEEERDSETIEAYVWVDWIVEAHLPHRPVYQNRNTLVLAGSVIGLCLGIIAFDLKYRYFSSSTQGE